MGSSCASTSRIPARALPPKTGIASSTASIGLIRHGARKRAVAGWVSLSYARWWRLMEAVFRPVRLQMGVLSSTLRCRWPHKASGEPALRYLCQPLAKFLTELAQIFRGNRVLLIHHQQREDAGTLELVREVLQPGNNMQMHVVEAFSLGEAHEVFFLHRSVGMHRLDQPVFDLRQLQEFLSGKLVQSLDVTSGQYHQPAQIGGGIG